MTKLGAHVRGVPRNGYGDFCAAKPAVVLSVDDGGALLEAWEKSGGATLTVFRDTSVYVEAPPGMNDPGIPPAYLAQQLYPALKAKWMQNPADAYTITNEQGGGGDDLTAIRRLVAYEREIMRLANTDGITVVVLNLASGSPTFNVWEAELAPFILEATLAGNCYGRHVYGRDPYPDLVNENGFAYPGNATRPFEEAEYFLLRSSLVPMIVTELGLDGGYGFAGSGRFYAQMTAYDSLMGEYPDILGAAVWELGTNPPFNANWQDAIPLLIPYMLAHPPEPPPPPAHKAIVVKLPQDMTRQEWLDAANVAYDYRHTMSASHDDMMTVLEGGNSESFVKFSHPERDAAAVMLVEENGYRWEPLYGGPSNPLIGLQLGYLFAHRYVLTSPFNAPRSYGLHEGVDYDLVGGQLDNKEPVQAVYPGTVDRSLDSTGDYGKYVRIAHEHNGSVFYTRYCHLDARFVEVGQVVAMGQPVGEIGTTGNVTGEHIHLNLEAPGYGLSGYVVADVVDPFPFLPDPSQLPLLPVGELIPLINFMKADPTAWRVVRHPSGSQEDFRDYDYGDGRWAMVKNTQAEWWKVNAGVIYLYKDNSPAPASDGTERLYCVTPGKWVKSVMQVGEEYNDGGHYVQFYRKSNCAPHPENSGNATNRTTLTKYAFNYTFNSYGQNLTLDEVVWLKNGSETQVFARHNGKALGRVGWSAPWGQSEIVELYFDRGVLTTPPVDQCPDVC